MVLLISSTVLVKFSEEKAFQIILSKLLDKAGKHQVANLFHQ
jgi:hypothetical protein